MSSVAIEKFVPDTKARTIAVLMILVCLIGLAANSWSSHFLNCDMECGETLLSVHAAQQYAARGAEFGLIENLGSGSEVVLYTHNVNIGNLTFVLLEALGIPDQSKLLLPLLIYGLGLYYVFLTVRRIGESETFALLALTVFAATYWGLGAFALNSLRAWHLYAFFGTIFHAYGLVAEKPILRRDVAGLVLAAIAAFGCGYDFWIICGAVAACVAIANADALRGAVRPGLIVALAFLVPLALRQIQIVSVMGPSYWLQDLIYSVAIKVPFGSALIEIPPLADIDEYYQAHHVFRPPAQPSNNVVQILSTFRHMIASITVPRWGALSLFTFVMVLVFPLLAIFFPVGGAGERLSTFSKRLIVPATIGTGIGLAVFAPFSLHVYFKHEMPLIAFLLLLAKALVIFVALEWAVTASRYQRAGAVAIIAVLVLDAGLAAWNSTRNGPALNFGWARALRQFPNERVALATYKTYPEADRFFGIDAGQTHFVPYSSVDVSTDRLFVYQPTERFVDFDSPVPDCAWTDWLRALVGWHGRLRPGNNCIYNQPVPVGAKPQPTIEQFVALAGDRFKVLDRNAYGIGYVVLERR